MKYFVYNFQHKGRPYAMALKSQGHLPNMRDPDIALFDRDWHIHNDGQARAEVRSYIEKGTVIALYPHSSLPPWWYDGMVKIHPKVACVFVIGEGQKDAMRFIEPDVKVEVSGWAWCSQKPFQNVKKIDRILFAPIHPSGGVLREEAYEANKAIFSELKTLMQEKKVQQVIIRYIGDLQIQGLEQENIFNWVHGRPDGSTRELDISDLVIAEGTFLSLAVARGKPAIGINQHLPVRANLNGVPPANWDKYGDDMAYPTNYSEGNLWDLANLAVLEEQSEWRERFIGGQLNAKTFSDKVKKLV